MLINQDKSVIADKQRITKPTTFIVTLLIISLITIALTSCKKDNSKSPNTTSDKSRGKYHLSNTSVEYFRFDPASDQVYAVGYERDSDLETGNVSETYNLYKADIDLYSNLVRKDVTECEPSPTGEYLLLNLYDDVSSIVIDAKTKKELKQVNLWLSGTRFNSVDKNMWLSDGHTLWKTKNDGLYLYDIKANKSEKLIDGDIIGHSFSKDMRYFLYEEHKGVVIVDGSHKDPYSDNISDRIGISAILKIFDRETKKSKVLIEEPSAWISNAIMSSDNKTIYYSLTTAKRDTDQRLTGTAQIKSIGIDGSNKQVLSEKPITVKRDRVDYLYQVYKLMFTKQEKGLLYEIENIEPDKNRGNYYYDLSIRKEKRAPGGYFVNRWDYNPKTNEVGWIGEDKIILEKVDY